MKQARKRPRLVQAKRGWGSAGFFTVNHATPQKLSKKCLALLLASLVRHRTVKLTLLTTDNGSTVKNENYYCRHQNFLGPRELEKPRACPKGAAGINFKSMSRNESLANVVALTSGINRRRFL